MVPLKTDSDFNTYRLIEHHRRGHRFVEHNEIVCFHFSDWPSRPAWIALGKLVVGFASVPIYHRYRAFNPLSRSCSFTVAAFLDQHNHALPSMKPSNGSEIGDH